MVINEFARFANELNTAGISRKCACVTRSLIPTRIRSVILWIANLPLPLPSRVYANKRRKLIVLFLRTCYTSTYVFASIVYSVHSTTVIGDWLLTSEALLLRDGEKGGQNFCDYGVRRALFIDISSIFPARTTRSRLILKNRYRVIGSNMAGLPYSVSRYLSFGCG